MVSLENQVSHGNKDLLRLEHNDSSCPIPGIYVSPFVNFLLLSAFCFSFSFISCQNVGSKLLSICKEDDKDMDKKKNQKNAQEFFQALGESSGKYLSFNYESVKCFLT